MEIAQPTSDGEQGLEAALARAAAAFTVATDALRGEVERYVRTVSEVTEAPPLP